MYTEIIYDVTDPVATITLNRPTVLNAWTNTMATELRDAVGRAVADPAVVGIVLTGAGRAFCAGADMKTLASLSHGGSDDGITDGASEAGERDGQGPRSNGDFDGLYTYLLRVPKPVIAAVNGPVAGMAYALVLCCDLRFIAPDAVMLTAFSQRGLVAEWGLAWLLPRLVGPGVALDLLYSSRKVRGDEAVRLGLANEVVELDRLLERAQDYVRDLAAGCSPASLAIMKRQVYEQLHAGLGPAYDESVQLMIDSFGRPDFAEGVSSFLEKRAPKFGRVTEGP